MRQKEKRKKRMHMQLPLLAQFVWSRATDTDTDTDMWGIVRVNREFIAPLGATPYKPGSILVVDARGNAVLRVRNCPYNKYRAEVVLNLCYARYGSEL